MTYLYGETTWGEMADKFIGLVTGAEADDQGTTVPGALAWRQPAVDPSMIAAQAQYDRPVTQEHRAGYWTRFDDNVLMNSGAAPKAPNQVCQQVTCWDGWYTTSYVAYIVSLSVITTNATVGDYSGAQVRLKMFSINTSNGTDRQSSGSTITLNAVGVGSYTYGGKTMTFKLSDPSGKLTTGCYYQRVFTPTYKGGIDVWRGFGRSIDAPTFTTPPPGTADDWGHTLDYNVRGDMETSYFEYPLYAYQFFTTFCWGLGIKTNAALTGARYEVSFNKVDSLGSIYTSTTSLMFQWGGTGMNPDIGGGTRYFGKEGWYQGSRNGKALSSPFGAAAPPEARVQYWMNVTDTHIAIVMNGEAAYSGRVSGNMIAKLKTIYDDDPGCWYFGSMTSWSQEAQWYRLGNAYMVEKVSAKGVNDGGRDWQTGEARLDMLGLPYDNNSLGSPFGFQSSSYGTASAVPNQVYNRDANTSGGDDSDNWVLPRKLTRDTSPVDINRWTMACLSLGDATGYAPSYRQGRSTIEGLAYPRGYVDEGLWEIPNGGFLDGDVLEDASTGEKWTLFQTNGTWGMSTGNGAAAALEQS